MIGVTITIVLIFITWIYEAFVDDWYKNNYFDIYKEDKKRKMELFETINLFLKAISFVGMTYSCVYMLFFWKR